MSQINKALFIILIYLQTFAFSQVSYIRSTLPNKNGVVYNPDNGRPFNNVAVEFYDNGQIKVKGRYAMGLAMGIGHIFMKMVK